MKKLMLLPLVLLMSWTVPAMGQINWTAHDIDNNFVGAWDVMAADVDLDGDIDVLGAAWEGNLVTWWENDGSQNFTEHTLSNSYGGARSVYAYDLDKDGDIDIISGGSTVASVDWWENDGSQNFTQHTVGSYTGAWDVYAIDVDGDNDVDIVTASIDNYVSWWENNGSQSFTRHDISTNFGSARIIHAHDVDGDGDIDVLGAAFFGDEIAWWENDGSENFTKHSITTSLDGASCVYASDIDRDGDIDVLAMAYTGRDAVWYENDGSENFTYHLLNGNYNYGTCITSSDVDGDGDVDIVGAGCGGGAGDINWWENDGSENFTEHSIYSATGFRWVYPIDMDRDGDIDAVGGAAYTGWRITWWESDLDPIIGISMIPRYLPITVRPIGNFRYTGILTNNTPGPVTTDVWLMVKLYNGNYYGPVERYNNVHLSANQTISISNIRQVIPGFAPVGPYEYVARCGDYPNTIVDEASFDFIIYPRSDSSAGGDWAVYGGWFDTGEEIPSELPSEYGLLTAYPNPFNASTTISFDLPENGHVRLDIYNVNGQKIETLIDGYMNAGKHAVKWDAIGYSSGIYFYSMSAGGKLFTNRMTLVK